MIRVILLNENIALSWGNIFYYEMALIAIGILFCFIQL